MALTPIWSDGFEHGVKGVGSAPGNGLYNVITGTNHAFVTDETPPYGVRSLRIASSASRDELALEWGGSNSRVLTTFRWKWKSGQGGFARNSFAGFTPRFDISNAGVVTLWSEIHAAITGPTITDNNWHRIAATYDGATSNSFQIGLWVDGTHYGFSTGTHTNGVMGIGHIWLGTVDTSTTMTVVYDDVAAFSSDAAFSSSETIPQRYVRGYSPNGVGTHNVGNAGHYFRDDGTGAEVEIVAGETVSWENVDDVPLNADAAHVVIK